MPQAKKVYKILFVGDIVARHGRRVVKKVLPELRNELGINFVIANGENLTTGWGMTKKAADEMFAAGVDFFTSGNHIWRKEEFTEELEKRDTQVIRPANYPKGTPGVGFKFVETDLGKIAILNLLGKEGIRTRRGEPEDVESPFNSVDRLIEEIKKENPIVVILDFHAELTSEKVAMGHYVDGRVTAVFGTHTHVPTADLRILPKGTAYVSDVGMTGPIESVLGVKTDIIVERFKGEIPRKFEVAEGEGVLNSVLLTLDESGKVLGFERVDRRGL